MHINMTTQKYVYACNYALGLRIYVTRCTYACMYVCMIVCVGVYMITYINTYLCMGAFAYDVYLRAHVYIYICM